MGYAAKNGVIIYWKPDHIYYLHRAHHVFFDEYNSRFSKKDKHTPDSLILQQYKAIFFQIPDQLNFIPREVDIYSTQFGDATMIQYKIELPPAGNKIGFDDDFTNPYIIDTITNLTEGHQLPTQPQKMSGLLI